MAREFRALGLRGLGFGTPTGSGLGFRAKEFEGLGCRNFSSGPYTTQRHKDSRVTPSPKVTWNPMAIPQYSLYIIP